MMIANAAPCLIVNEPQTLFATGCSLPRVLDLLSLFLHIDFLLEADCSPTAAATCETNSLEYGWKVPIVKARLLTLTQNES